MTATAFSFVFAFVLLLGVLIAVHEFGHFLAAKLCGVRVLKFSLGFGPPVGLGRFRLRWERGGTEYVVAWFPLGGFVKMLGENPGDEDSPEARASVRYWWSWSPRRKFASWMVPTGPGIPRSSSGCSFSSPG